MCSLDGGLWCWDATTQAACDDAASQRLGWRGVLSFSFEVGVRQGRVTLPCKSLRGVRAPNNYPPDQQVSRRIILGNASGLYGVPDHGPSFRRHFD